MGVRQQGYNPKHFIRIESYTFVEITEVKDYGRTIGEEPARSS